MIQGFRIVADLFQELTFWSPGVTRLDPVDECDGTIMFFETETFALVARGYALTLYPENYTPHHPGAKPFSRSEVEDQARKQGCHTIKIAAMCPNKGVVIVDSWTVPCA
jgi:hypothetical protein